MNISERLERLPLIRLHWKILLLCGIGWMFDSMDVGLVSFVMPAVQKQWTLSPSQLGILGSVTMVGMCVGAAVVGMLAEQVGPQANHALYPCPVRCNVRLGRSFHRSDDAGDFSLFRWRGARW